MRMASLYNGAILIIERKYMFSVVFGSDIEYFVLNNKGNIIAAQDVLNKTSNISTITKDGIQLEVNPQPTSCRENVCERTKKLLETINERGIRISKTSVVNIKKTTFNKISDEDKQLGCLPDINAYTMEENIIPGDPNKLRTRTAGGHIHISNAYRQMKLYLGENSTIIDLREAKHINIHEFPLEKQNINTFPNIKNVISDKFQKNWSILECLCSEVKQIRLCQLSTYAEKKEKIKILVEKNIDKIEIQFIPKEANIPLLKPEITIPILDLFVGIPSILLDNNIKQILRRKYYGMAGSFRYTNYGLEYRVLSNFWSFNRAITSLMFGQIREGLRYACLTIKHNYKPVIDYIKQNQDKIIYTINNADHQTAKEILDKFLFKILRSTDTPIQWSKDNAEVPLGTIDKQYLYKKIACDGIKNDNYSGWENLYNTHGGPYLRGEIDEQWKNLR